MPQNRSSKNGWVGPALIVGGSLALGAALIAAFNRNRTTPSPTPDALDEAAQVRAFIWGTVNDICAALGIPPVPVAFTDDPGVNAASDGAQVIVNTGWIAALMGRHCADATCFSAVAEWVLAHELAHHVHGDAKVPKWIGGQHFRELRADYYAGRALAHFHKDPSVLASVLRDIAPIATPTHPAFHDRLKASHEGFSDYVLEAAFLGSQRPQSLQV